VPIKGRCIAIKKGVGRRANGRTTPNREHALRHVINLKLTGVKESGKDFFWFFYDFIRDVQVLTAA
jgi:hypothetical protein